MPDPTKPILKAIPVQPGEKEASAPSPAPVPTDTVTTVVRPSGSPVEVRRAIPVVRPTPKLPSQKSAGQRQRTKTKAIRMASADAENFRLAVLNPAGRDHEQHFAENRSAPANEHAPVNFHAYAACTHGAVFRDLKRAIASGWPVLLLLRGDFRASERALAELKKSKRKTVVALKETGAHQVAQQLSDPTRFARFIRIVRAANGCVASTPEVADFFRFFRDDGIEYLPTPYPIEDENWNWAMENRSGIFVGTREFAVPTRNHLPALLAVKKLSDATKSR